MANWTTQDVPNLDGKTIVVTGANSGIGFEATRHLARQGAHVVLACRNQDKGQRALKDLHEEFGPDIRVALMELDLADLSSVRQFAADFSESYDALDVLINNAGVMAIPRRETQDGFEMQLGTNHMGHFALTGLLLDRLLAAPEARVVSVSSMAHRMGKMNFEDLHSEGSYDKWGAYGQSKLANLLFTFELDRRVKAAKLPIIAAACHPGYSATNLQLVGPKMSGSSVMEKLSRLANKFVAQSAEMGALPTLYAATAADVQGGDYIGPDGLFEMTGYPEKVEATSAAHDPRTATRLWERSEEATGVHYDLLSTDSHAA